MANYLTNTEELTSVANAIRAKSGGSSPLEYPDGFVSEIESIPSGGGTGEPSNDVNFYDYDGTIVHSYSAADFANLSAMPDNPDRTAEGLVAQGWNWSLADAKTYVSKYGMLDVGQMYITDDGKTRLYITIPTTGRMSPTLYFSQTVANGVTIDWGDGSATETVAGTGNKNVTHTYAAIGDYIITLNPVNNCTIRLGTGSGGVFGADDAQTVYMNMLKKIEVGKNITAVGAGEWRNARSLTGVTLPYGVTQFGTIPTNAYGLRHFTLPNSLATVSNSGAMSSDFLKSLSLPNTISNLGSSTFSGNKGLTRVTIPTSISTIGASAFSSCFSLVRIAIPKEISTISASAFSLCIGAKTFDFSHHTSIPTLSNANAFSYISSDAQILVPYALYDTWKAASNWSTYASQIVAV